MLETDPKIVRITHEDLIRVTRDVCAGLFGIDPSPEIKVRVQAGDVIVGTIRYAGAWNAVLTVQSGVGDAVRLVFRLAGSQDEDPVGQATDLVGELTNVLAGKLKCSLPRGADNGIPTVFVRRPQPMKAEDDRVVVQPFAYGSGSLVVMFEAGGVQA